MEFPDPEFHTAGFLNGLAYPDAALVGFYHLDEGDSASEGQAEREQEFTAELEEQAERFERRGIRTEHDHDRVETRRRIAQGDGVDAVLLPGGRTRSARC